MSPFSDMSFNMESSATTTFFLFLCFDSLFLSSFPISVLLAFCISVLILVLLGSRWSFLVDESEFSKFLIFPFNTKTIMEFFLINCFSKVNILFQILFKTSTKSIKKRFKVRSLNLFLMNLSTFWKNFICSRKLFWQNIELLVRSSAIELNGLLGVCFFWSITRPGNAVIRRCFSKKFPNIHRKTPVSRLVPNKVACLKKETPAEVFSIELRKNFAEQLVNRAPVSSWFWPHLTFLCPSLEDLLVVP